MREFMAAAKALGDETRVRFLLALGDGELCVRQLIEVAGLAPSTVSKHLSILRLARLIDGRKEGRWMYYRLADDPPGAVRGALDWVRASLSEDPKAREDRRRLRGILRTHPEELCRKQARR